MKNLKLLPCIYAHKKTKRRELGLKTAVFAMALCLILTYLSSATPTLLASEAVSIPADFAGFKAIVVGDACNLRTGPGTNYASKGLVLQGTWLDIVTKENDWLKVRYKNEEVWIADWLVDIDLSSHNIRIVITKT
ncbi:MAG TPA: SH3 domain-containing protein, partial [Bacillota bacterium]|nr:SH3 domain-containing protein [Bacillota bacterium]